MTDSQTVRVRFAPSPTGHLHIGGARTALFNWLFARQNRGTFVLRIDDTDRERSTPEAFEAILDGLRWLGLHWDGEPIFQSQRTPIYTEAVAKLLKEGKAYRCYCTPEELEARRKALLQARKKPQYDGTCRNRTDLPEGQPFTVRFKAPQEGVTEFTDRIKGKLLFQNRELDDLILLRADGSPTYNLCVVIDDATMKITHVIRGDDHLNNTPRQILLYQALGYPLPQFAHVPLILGTDRARLSKRHGATSLAAYREQGYLPEAMINYLARLGWSYKDEEIFTRDDLLQKFRIEDVGKSAAIFNPEKLLWLNAHHMRAKANEELCAMIHPPSRNDPSFLRLMTEVKTRARTLNELREMTEFYFASEVTYDEKAREKFLTPENGPILKEVFERFKKLDTLSFKNVEKTFMELAEEKGLKLGAVAQPVRVALTGRTVSPGIFEVIEILGPSKVLPRLERALSIAS